MQFWVDFFILDIYWVKFRSSSGTIFFEKAFKNEEKIYINTCIYIYIENLSFLTCLWSLGPSMQTWILSRDLSWSFGFTIWRAILFLDRQLMIINSYGFLPLKLLLKLRFEGWTIILWLTFVMSGEKVEIKRKPKGLTWAEASAIVSWNDSTSTLTTVFQRGACDYLIMLCLLLSGFGTVQLSYDTQGDPEGYSRWKTSGCKVKMCINIAWSSEFCRSFISVQVFISL